MNKRGFDTGPVKFVGILVLGFIIVSVFSNSVIIPTLQWLEMSTEGQVTLSNFEGLTNKIYSMVDNKEKFVAERNFPFYLEEEYVLVGFNKGTEGVVSTCYDIMQDTAYVLDPRYGKLKSAKAEIEGTALSHAAATEIVRKADGFLVTDNTLQINKPISQCGDSACLCLYKQSDLLVSGQPTFEECALFNDVDVINVIKPPVAQTMLPVLNAMFVEFRGGLANNEKKIMEINDKGGTFRSSNLVLYGECGVAAPEADELALNYGKELNTDGLGVINLYIEKGVYNNLKYISVMQDAKEYAGYYEKREAYYNVK